MRDGIAGGPARRVRPAGRTVVGVDPAEASLAVARSKDPAGRVRWILGEVTDVPALGADLATMTGNVAQVFLTDGDWGRALRGVHAALRPHGWLVFETRRPQRRAWQEWARDVEPIVLTVAGVGRVERRLEVTDVRLPLVSFRYTYRFLTDGVIVTSERPARGRVPAGATAVNPRPDQPLMGAGGPQGGGHEFSE